MSIRSPLFLRRLGAALLGPLLLVMAWAFAAPSQAAAEFLPPEQAFALQVDASAADAVRLQWTIAPGYYLYRSRMHATDAATGSALAAELPPGIRKDDPNFGVMEVYHDSATMTVAPAGASALDVTWQGCADAGLCYPPQTQRVAVAALSALGAVPDPSPAALPSPGATAQPANAGAGAWWDSVSGSDRQITQWLGVRSLLWSLPLFFVLGIALAFTPCVLPMLPIVSGVVVGSQATARRAFALSMAFVLPMALTYAGLGAAAALAGANLQAMLQNRWTMLVLGGVYIGLALGMFGFFTLQLPQRLRDRLDAASRGQRGGSLKSAAALGVLSALLVGPCLTAPLAGALLYIAQSGKVAEGGLLLLALGLGMGAPLVLAGTLGARFLPRPGVWMDRVKGALGFVLLGTAVWMFERVVSPATAMLMWGALLLAVAVTLAHLASRPAPASAAGPGSPQRLATRTLAVVAGLWGSAMLLGAAGGAADPWRPLAFVAGSHATLSTNPTTTSSTTATALASNPSATALRFEPIGSLAELQTRLAAARAAGQTTVVDFYADWCISCKAIEKEVFGDPRVRQALSGAVLLRADVTANNALQRELMQSLGVLGPPTVLLFDAAGVERRDARLVGEFTADRFLQRHLQRQVASPAAPGVKAAS